MKIKEYHLLILLIVQTPLFAQPLFSEIVFLNSSRLEPTERQGFEGYVDVNLLNNNTFQLLLPDGELHVISSINIKSNTIGGYSWNGIFKDNPKNHINLSFINGAISGLISAQYQTYEVQPLGSNKVRVVEIISENFASCIADDATPNKIYHNKTNIPKKTVNATTEIDVMVLYTPQARDGAGGVNAIQAVAQAAVETINSSLNNSLVDVHFNLIHTSLANYNDTGSSSDDLFWVRTDPDVQQLRNLHGADMTALLVNSFDACGRGYVMRNPSPGFESLAYQVTQRSCAVGNLSFAHEFGHNMGLEHDPDNSGAFPNGASYDWSFGHNYPGSYRTIMSYNCSPSCPRRQYFSNPNVIYLGETTGVVDERDNARTIRLTSDIVSNFRSFPLLIFTSSFE